VWRIVRTSPTRQRATRCSPFIVAQQAHWQALVHSLLELQPDQPARDATAAAFGALLSTNGVTASLTRPNRTRFRANLQLLLQHVQAGGIQLPR